VLFRILEYLEIGIIFLDIVHENPIMSVCWVDIDILNFYVGCILLDKITSM
jgi:hypothetical protein